MSSSDEDVERTDQTAPHAGTVMAPSHGPLPDADWVEPMYCPSCDQMVPEYWDPVDGNWRCPACASSVYESKEDYIKICHATARWEKENGWGAWYDGEDGDRDE